MLSILYHSWYGSARRYAQHLAKIYHVEAEDLSSYRLSELEDSTDPLVLFSAIHGPSVPAVDFVRRHPQLIKQRPTAIACVGMTLLSQARSQDKMAQSLGDLAPDITRFYLPGRLAYSELNRKHRIIMKGMVSALKAKPHRSANEESMIATYGKDTDWVDFSELDPISQWIRGCAG